MKGLASAALAVVLTLQSGPSTSLRLTFRGPNGETVRPDRVTLLLDWWGGGEQEVVPISGNVATLNADDRRFGDPKARPNEASRILVEAKGYASALSEPFDWPQHSGPFTVAFRGGTATVREGQIADLRVALRRPQPRALRFIDQTGAAAIGISVDIYMFWTRQNHCGVFEGNVLTTGLTNAQGQLSVPDGDFDYGVALPTGADDVVFDHEPVFYEKIVRATQPVTMVVVHHFTGRPVTVDVVADNATVAGLQVLGSDRYNGCMDPGIRPLGVTDTAGRAAVQSFSSDRFHSISICRNGTELWHGPATVLDKSLVRIVLDPSYKPSDPTTDLCANRR